MAIVLEEEFLEHLKLVPIEEMGPTWWAKAIAFWLSCDSYARRNNTGGVIARSRLGRIAAPLSVRDATKLSEAFVASGLFERHDLGYTIHDFEARGGMFPVHGDADDHEEPNERQRRLSAARSKRWRDAKKRDASVTHHADSVTDCVTRDACRHADRHAPQVPPQTPSPNPISEPNPNREDAREAASRVTQVERDAVTVAGVTPSRGWGRFAEKVPVTATHQPWRYVAAAYEEWYRTKRGAGWKPSAKVVPHLESLAELIAQAALEELISEEQATDRLLANFERDPDPFLRTCDWSVATLAQQFGRFWKPIPGVAGTRPAPPASSEQFSSEDPMKQLERQLAKAAALGGR